VKCRSCNGDLVKGSQEAVRVQSGRVGVDTDGNVDFDEKDPPWGYMHLRCFYVSVGDPKAIDPWWSPRNLLD
jgi:hypothetical protein